LLPNLSIHTPDGVDTNSPRDQASAEVALCRSHRMMTHRFASQEGRAYTRVRAPAAAGRGGGGARFAVASSRRAHRRARRIRLDVLSERACLVRAPWPLRCRTSRRPTPPTRSRWWLRCAAAARPAAVVARHRVARGQTRLCLRLQQRRRRTAPRRWRLLWRRCGRAGARGARWRAQPQPSASLRWLRRSAPRLQPPRAPRCRCVPLAPRHAGITPLRCARAARARGA